MTCFYYYGEDQPVSITLLSFAVESGALKCITYLKELGANSYQKVDNWGTEWTFDMSEALRKDEWDDEKWVSPLPLHRPAAARAARAARRRVGRRRRLDAHIAASVREATRPVACLLSSYMLQIAAENNGLLAATGLGPQPSPAVPAV